MAALRQLRDPCSYRACDWDLKTDLQGRAYWIELFRWHLDAVVIPLIRQEYSPSSARLAAFRADYLEQFDRIALHPEWYQRLDVLFFTELREQLQLRHGFEDPYRGVKQQANAAAFQLLPDILAELDHAPPAKQRELLVDGLMAGNVFDLGSPATLPRQRDADVSFRRTRAAQASRRLYDDAQAWWARWDAGQVYRHAVFFVDNAGGDILLGCLPLARWMLARGTRVTLAANAGPALNDITAAELEPLLRHYAQLDSVIAAHLNANRLRVLATGSRTPLLDLTRLTDEFVADTADADLVILHGMGRAIESNLHAEFCCDALATAVLKDEAVARRVGGKLFDCLLRFRLAT